MATNNTKIKQTIEAILFISGSPVSLDELSRLLETDRGTVIGILAELQQDLENRGIAITESNGTYQMTTSPDPEVSAVVTNHLQAQLREKLTDAAVETLAVIAYKQPVSRAEIEAIRGVNCQYVLKVLSQRGLIEKNASSSDSRVVLYSTTHEFLHQLGLQSPAQLPQFEELAKELDLGEAQA